MRFLVDNALSPVLATLLARAGHDALHVRTIELQRAEDIVIFDKAAADDRIVVSADTDFGALLAARNVQKPSVIQFRGPGSRKPDALTHAILSNLSQACRRTGTRQHRHVRTVARARARTANQHDVRRLSESHQWN